MPHTTSMPATSHGDQQLDLFEPGKYFELDRLPLRLLIRVNDRGCACTADTWSGKNLDLAGVNPPGT